MAVAGLLSLGDEAATPSAADLMRSTDATTAALEELFEAFLNHQGSADLLATHFRTTRPTTDNAKVGLRVLYAIGRPEPLLESALREAAGLAARRKPPTKQQIAQLAKDAMSRGDAARGEAIFRRRELNCLACHAVSGAGGDVGPDLLGIGTSAPADYLVESLLDPGKKVKEGYVAATVVTVAGRVFTGVKVNENNTHVTLRSSTREDIVISKRDIAHEVDAGSVMPAGVIDLLTRPEQMDLVRFLSQLGKPGPYEPSPRRFVRSWSVLTSTQSIPTSLDVAAIAGRLSASDESAWRVAIGRVAGDLPIDDLPTLGETQIHVLRSRMEIRQAGRITLSVNDPRGISIHVHGTTYQADASSTIALDLPVGSYHLLWRVDGAARDNKPIQVELN